MWAWRGLMPEAVSRLCVYRSSSVCGRLVAGGTGTCQSFRAVAKTMIRLLVDKSITHTTHRERFFCAWCHTAAVSSLDVKSTHSHTPSHAQPRQQVPTAFLLKQHAA